MTIAFLPRPSTRFARLAATPVFLLLVASPAATAGPAGLSPERSQVLATVCGTCHARPGIAAPQVGDAAAWAEARAKGMDTLLANTVNGIGRMPPLGTCSWCSEADLRALIAVLTRVAPGNAP